MADDRYDWLDKDTAEQLLRGEQVSARNGDGARELEQLLEAAAAVAARTPEAVELPGEEAAVAAFRQAVRHGSGARNRTAGAPAPGARTAHTADLAERTRLGRPVRRGFAVALAACAIGGVAVAAGTGVLPTPFRGGGDPAPASSVSAVETPGPFRTGEPGAQTDGTTGQTPDATPDPKRSEPPESPRPGSSPGASKNPGSGTPSGGTGRGSDKPGGSDGKEPGPGHGDTKNFLLGLCQSYESGKRDGMDRDTLRRLERKAGGPEKVHVFCRAYLARYQNGGGSGGDDGFGGSTGESGGGSGGDEDDESHPPRPPGASPGTGTSTPAPGPSATAPDPGDATPSGTADGPV
ncbi:hypothetical protein OG754_15640 [Streptomyces decoyicus]|uniref:hypothetical protein n=1 Tax=Streptomyces decoyicus TaxID=249567 RepID=UPI002E335789|nr:hypothetical protein [Streptomyces decoyicus]